MVDNPHPSDGGYSVHSSFFSGSTKTSRITEATGYTSRLLSKDPKMIFATVKTPTAQKAHLVSPGKHDHVIAIRVIIMG